MKKSWATRWTEMSPIPALWGIFATTLVIGAVGGGLLVVLPKVPTGVYQIGGTIAAIALTTWSIVEWRRTR